MSELALTVRVQVLNSSKPTTDDTYQLVAYAPRDTQPHSAFDCVQQLPSETSTVTCHLAYIHQLPRKVHFLLFVKAPDSNHIVCQTLLAWGSAVLEGTGSTCNLVDVKDVSQARLTLTHEDVGPPADDAPSLTLDHTLFGYVSRAYDKLEDTHFNVDSFLQWVATPLGKAPVLSFIAQTKSILADPKVDTWTSQTLMVHLLRVAQHNLKQPSWLVDELSDSDKARLLAEMVTLIPRAMIYEPDTVRTDSNGHTAPSDQWVHILSFPQPNCAGYDCEDATLQALEMLYLLRHTDLSDCRDLVALQEFIAPYTACFVFGSLSKNGANTSHAYCALVDTAFVADGTQSTRPAIIFEGTARIGGLWEHSSSPATEASFEAHSTLLQALPSDAGYCRVIRSEATMGIVQDKGIYGPVYALMADDVGGSGAARHLLLHRTGARSVGVPAEEAFGVGHTTATEVAGEISVGHDDPALNDLPRSHIPFVTTCTVGRKPAGLFHVDVHYETYVARKAQIHAALSELKERYVIDEHIVQITDKLHVAQLWFTEK